MAGRLDAEPVRNPFAGVGDSRAGFQRSEIPFRKESPVTRLFRLCAACIAGAAFTACGSGGGSSLPGAAAVTSGTQPSAIASQRRPAKAEHLYVANAGPSTVTVYAANGSSVLRTISDGVSQPDAMAFDAAGNLYVANAGTDTVTVYAPGSSSVLRTVSRGVDDPAALALDANGNLYVANAGANTVTAYTAGDTALMRTITQGINAPDALVFGAAGNLDVGNVYDGGYDEGSVTVYTSAKGKPRKTLPQGSAPVALAFDDDGNLYVDNDAPMCCPQNWVAVYSPNKKLLRTIGQVHHPDALTFGDAGNLYVADNGGKYVHPVGQITVYAPGGSDVLWSVTTGVSHPVALAFHAHDLFVANAATVTVYAHGQDLVRTISQGIGNPRALSFGP